MSSDLAGFFSNIFVLILYIHPAITLYQTYSVLIGRILSSEYETPTRKFYGHDMWPQGHKVFKINYWIVVNVHKCYLLLNKLVNEIKTFGWKLIFYNYKTHTS